MEKKRLGVLGSGFLGGIIARAWKDGLLPDYELVGIAGRNGEKTAALAGEVGCRACADLAEHGAKVYIASGAVGGFDVLRTVSLMGQTRAAFETRKGPRSLRGTPLYREELEQREEHVFSGSAKEVIALLPTKVNVAVAASLATVGPERISVDILSAPGFVGDDHRITAETEGVKAVVDIYSSTSAIAGWSVVAALQNLTAPIQF